MKNTSMEDYDIYNPCINVYDDGCIIAYPILFYHTDNTMYANDGFSKIGFWTSNDYINFTQLNNKYMEFDYWCEFATGHYEDHDKYIHYYIETNQTHGSPVIGKTELYARIHYKY